MEELDSCKIEFKGLKQGEHQFIVNLADSFLSEQGINDISNLKLAVEILLVKRERFLEAFISMGGLMTVQCDRCLDDMELSINNETRLLVRIEADENVSIDREDVISINENDYFVDFTQVVYELLVLSIPLKKVHGCDENGNSLCNCEMLSYISQEVDDEEDYETDDEEEGAEDTEDDIDPRWDGLRNINFKDN